MFLERIRQCQMNVKRQMKYGFIDKQTKLTMSDLGVNTVLGVLRSDSWQHKCSLRQYNTTVSVKQLHTFWRTICYCPFALTFIDGLSERENVFNEYKTCHSSQNGEMDGDCELKGKRTKNTFAILCLHP